MDLRTANDSESRFSGYVEGLVSVIGHADRAHFCLYLEVPLVHRPTYLVHLRPRVENGG